MLKITATIDDRTKVILKGDGTWEFADGNCENQETEDHDYDLRDFDVRNLKWGMTRSEVIESERENGSELLTNEIARTKFYGWDKHKDDYILFSSSINTKDTHLICQFIKNKLVRLSIVISANHYCDNKYIEDFYWLDDELSNKYGKYISCDQIWHGDKDRYQYNVEKWGAAISLGYLALKSKWDLGRTKIDHLLGRGKNISHRIEFICKDMEKYLEKETNKKIYNSI